MKKQIRNYIVKILALVAALMLALLLCGCRTRVTNNTEVSSVVSDENGILQENYQVRRDELGIPVAQEPLFSWFDSEDEEYDEGYEDYEFEQAEDEEFEEEDEEEDEDEDEEVEDNTTTTSRTTTPIRRTPVRRPATQPVRRTTGTQTTGITVTLSVNGKGAKCSKSSITVKKGSTYGSLPTPTWKGYDFEGWFTKKTGGSQVTSKTKVSSDKAHTLYAHWTEAKAATYTITFDGNGDGDEVTLSSSEMTVTEGGTYGDMPSAKRKKYSFKGWFTEADGGSQVTSGSKFTANANQTLYAHWEFDPYTWWDAEFTTAVNDMDDESKKDCIIDEGDKTEDSFVKESGGKVVDKEPAYVIKFIKNFDKADTEQIAKDLYEKHGGEEANVTIIIVSDEALKGSKEQKLAYKMKLHDALNGEGADTEEAISELLDGETVEGIYVYPEA